MTNATCHIRRLFARSKWIRAGLRLFRERRYPHAVSILIVLTSVGIRFLFLPGLGMHTPFVTFYPAVILAALYGGFYPGILAAVLSALLADYFWMEPGGSLKIDNFYDGLGIVIFMLSCAMVSAVTEAMRRAQARAAQDQQRLLLALESAQLGDWEVDLVTQRGRRSPRHDHIFGYPDLLPEWTYPMFLEHVHPDDRPRVDRTFQECVATGRDWVFECRIIRADKTEGWIWARGRTFKDKTGRPVRVVGIIGDMTERKQVEESLRQSQEYRRLMIESVKDYAVILLDARGNVRSWNPGAEQIKGYRADEIIGRHFSCFYPEQKIREGFPEFELKAAAEKGRYEDEGWRVRKDGSLFWANVVISAVCNSNGELIGYAKFTRDVTQRKEADERIQKLNEDLQRHAEELEVANKELESFSYTVSHDLRTPLRAVDGFSQMVLEDYGPQLPPEGQRQLQTVRAGAQRMGKLVDDLLTFSRLGRAAINRQKINTNSLVDDVLEELDYMKEGRSIALKRGDLPPCEGDQALLRQVWINLLANALKYTSRRPHAVIEIGSMRAQEETIYFVRDNGVGFDMKYAHKLFGVFQRLHRVDEFEGTGVGLANVQRIVQRHGGRIWVKAALDEGATFSFTLQAAPQPAANHVP